MVHETDVSYNLHAQLGLHLIEVESQLQSKE